MMSRLAVVLLSADLLACSGTGDGGTGDPPAEPLADPLGQGARISEIVGPATWLNLADEESLACEGIPEDRNVQITGQVIVAIDEYDETQAGARGNFYIQDAIGEPIEYSGITVFRPSFSPPDLRLAPGDVVDTLGTLMEFPGPPSSLFGGCKTLPEIGGTMSMRFESQLPAPKLLVPAEGANRWEILTSYEAARPWIGTLVRIENVPIGGVNDAESGRYTADIAIPGIDPFDLPEISNELYDVKLEGPVLDGAPTFKSVTGILTYFFSFRIAPRSPEDFEL